jgi:hypothetical protein
MTLPPLQRFINPASLEGMEWLKELDYAIEQLHEYRSMLIAKHGRLSKRLSLLEEKPHYENARIWFRKGQYAYLHLSLQQGGRSRTYIGTNANRIASVEEAIVRGEKVSELKVLIKSIEEQARRQARRVRSSVG